MLLATFSFNFLPLHTLPNSDLLSFFFLYRHQRIIFSEYQVALFSLPTFFIHQFCNYGQCSRLQLPYCSIHAKSNNHHGDKTHPCTNIYWKPVNYPSHSDTASTFPKDTLNSFWIVLNTNKTNRNNPSQLIYSTLSLLFLIYFDLFTAYSYLWCLRILDLWQCFLHHHSFLFISPLFGFQKTAFSNFSYPSLPPSLCITVCLVAVLAHLTLYLL